MTCSPAEKARKSGSPPQSQPSPLASLNPFRLETDDTLVLMRVVVGLLFVYEGLHVVLDDKIHRRYLDSYLIIPFAYVPWWVADIIPRSYAILAGLHYLIAALGFLVTIGHYTERSLAAALAIRAYLFFSNQLFFLNHHYAQLLFSLLVLLMPSSASRSVDSYFSGRPLGERALVPVWMRWSMQLLFHSMFIYAALAKIHFDWLRGQPVAEWFTLDALITHLSRWSPYLAVKVGTLAPVRALYAWWFLPYAIALGGIAWDFAAPFLGCLGRSGTWPRKLLLFASIIGTAVFNGLNHLHMGIGIFPYMVTALSAVLYWFRPADACAEVRRQKRRGRGGYRPRVEPPLSWRFFAVAAVMAVVLSLPLRSYLIAGDPQYDGTGYYFAWRMKNGATRTESECYIHLLDPDTGAYLTAEPYRFDFAKTKLFPTSPGMAALENRHGGDHEMRPLMTRKTYKKLLDHPHTLTHVAEVVRRRFEDYLCPDRRYMGRPCKAEVRMDLWRSKNFRRHQRVIGEQVDLASDGIVGTWPHTWVEPEAPVEGWHRYQTLPVIVKHLLTARDGEYEESANPCWPWTGAYRRDDKDGRRLCTVWWYRPGGGRDMLQQSGGDGWLERLFHPAQGFNDKEPCRKALGWWFNDRAAAVLCDPDSYVSKGEKSEEHGISKAEISRS